MTQGCQLHEESYNKVAYGVVLVMDSLNYSTAKLANEPTVSRECSTCRVEQYAIVVPALSRVDTAFTLYSTVRPTWI